MPSGARGVKYRRIAGGLSSPTLSAIPILAVTFFDRLAVVVSRIRNTFSAAAMRVAPQTYDRLRLGRQLTRDFRERSAPSPSAFTVSVHQRNFAEPHTISIARRRNRIKISCQCAMFGKSPLLFRRLSALVPIVAGWPSEHARLVAEISSSEHSGPGLVSFCSRDPRAILIPDEFFFRSRGYENYRCVARLNRADWDGRSNHIVWRGSTNGVGAISKDHLSAEDPELLPRVRLCLEMRGVPDSDVKLSAVGQSRDARIHEDRLTKAGIFGEYISPLAWCGLKFAIDIDGHTNAWSNFFTRLIMGCCVLKIGSALGYRQWYYDEVKPWVHYVPVTADLSDLHERIAWCRAHLAECRRIAERGQEFAMARDYETELASAIRRVSDASENGALRSDIAVVRTVGIEPPLLSGTAF